MHFRFINVSWKTIVEINRQNDHYKSKPETMKLKEIQKWRSGNNNKNNSYRNINNFNLRPQSRLLILLNVSFAYYSNSKSLFPVIDRVRAFTNSFFYAKDENHIDGFMQFYDIVLYIHIHIHTRPTDDCDIRLSIYIENLIIRKTETQCILWRSLNGFKWMGFPFRNRGEKNK